MKEQKNKDKKLKKQTMNYLISVKIKIKTMGQSIKKRNNLIDFSTPKDSIMLTVNL
jgi:hypothetical protein